MGRVSATAVQPMTALGDLIYGGGGSPTGYANKALASLGASCVTHDGGGGNNVIDANDATTGSSVGSGGVGSWFRIDLGSAKRIGRHRLVQGDRAGFSYTALYRVESSVDGVNWTTRQDNVVGIDGDGGYVELPVPITARYWRVYCLEAAHFLGATWKVQTLAFDEVTTVGAGNPTRLPPPASRRVLTFDPDSSVPSWPAPAAANPDTSGATLVQLEGEVNELKSALRAAGILAS